MTDVQDPFRESTGLYVLGALSPDDRSAFERHMVTCDACTAEVRQLRDAAEALPHSVMQVEPDADLRRRVLAAAAAARRPMAPLEAGDAPRDRGAERARAAVSAPAWLAVAASLILAIGSGLYAAQLRARLDTLSRRLADVVSQLQDTRQQLQVANRATDVAQARLTVISAPDVVELRLAGQRPAPQARARAFLSPSQGLLFAANNLPSIPEDRTYQLWFLTPGAPISAGLLRPDGQGNATAVFDVPSSAASPTGLAVSLEPAGGVPAPTGALYLVSQ